MEIVCRLTCARCNFALLLKLSDACAFCLFLHFLPRLADKYVHDPQFSQGLGIQISALRSKHVRLHNILFKFALASLVVFVANFMYRTPCDTPPSS